LSAELVLSHWTSILLFASPSPSQGDRLGGPEKMLFERSPGVGREERPPNTVVIQL